MARRGGYIGWRWMTLGAAAIVAVFIVALAAVRADLHELQVQEATLSLQMQLLEADYESLADELTRVGTDSYVENAARENYGFIRNGEIVFSLPIGELREKYRAVAVTAEQAETYGDKLIGCKRAKEGFTALVERGGLEEELPGRAAGLEEIMVHLDKEARDDG